MILGAILSFWEEVGDASRANAGGLKGRTGRRRFAEERDGRGQIGGLDVKKKLLRLEGALL